MTREGLAARNLTFGYGPGAHLFDHWTHTFPPGSSTAITGSSGRGKSTLLYMLGLMLRPLGGEIALDGRVLSTQRDSDRARLRASLFGFVFQDAALDLSRTVMDNVTESALYRGASRSSVEKDARHLLEKFEVDLPPDRKPGQISGGQAQRVALCRALLNRPQIVLADEPTGNLDPVTANLVVDALQERAVEGSVVVIVTHSKEVAEKCDRELTL